VYVNTPGLSGCGTVIVARGTVPEVIVSKPSPYGPVLDVVCLLESARIAAARVQVISSEQTGEVCKSFVGEEACWLATRRKWMDASHATPAARIFPRNIMCVMIFSALGST
jgi:hypothetical protein